MLPTDADGCVYVHHKPIHHTNGHVTMGKLDCVSVVHTDDGALYGEPKTNEKVVSALRTHFKVKALNSTLNPYLALKIVISDDNQSISISQEAYIEALLAKYETDITEFCNTTQLVPTGTSHPAEPPDVYTEKEREFMKHVNLFMIVGELRHIFNGTRPDIGYAVGYVSRQVANPRKVHYVAALTILAYLKHTKTYGIRYSRMPRNRDGTIKPTVYYSDSNWAGKDNPESKSTTCYVGIFGNAAIDWGSQLQSFPARSSAIAEIVALDTTTKRALWLRKLEGAFHIGNGSPTIIHEDNDAAIAISAKERRTKRTRHVAVKYFATNHNIKEGDVSISPVASADNTADIGTKALPRVPFEKHREGHGVVDLSK
jgi:hypothetical protein